MTLSNSTGSKASSSNAATKKASISMMPSAECHTRNKYSPSNDGYGVSKIEVSANALASIC